MKNFLTIVGFVALLVIMGLITEAQTQTHGRVTTTSVTTPAPGFLWENNEVQTNVAFELRQASGGRLLVNAYSFPINEAMGKNYSKTVFELALGGSALQKSSSAEWESSLKLKVCPPVKPGLWEFGDVSLVLEATKLLVLHVTGPKPIDLTVADNGKTKGDFPPADVSQMMADEANCYKADQDAILIIPSAYAGDALVIVRVAGGAK